MLGACGVLPFSGMARLRPSTRRKSLWSAGCIAIRAIPSMWACSRRLSAGLLCSEERTCSSTRCASGSLSTYLSCSTRSPISGDSSVLNITITAKRSVDGCRVFADDRPSNRAMQGTASQRRFAPLFAAPDRERSAAPKHRRKTGGPLLESRAPCQYNVVRRDHRSLGEDQ